VNTKRVELKNRLCLLAKIRVLSVERQALASTHYAAISEHQQFHYIDQSERIATSARRALYGQLHISLRLEKGSVIQRSRQADRAGRQIRVPMAHRAVLSGQRPVERCTGKTTEGPGGSGIRLIQKPPDADLRKPLFRYSTEPTLFLPSETGSSA
jgi:hypothetical protein